MKINKDSIFLKEYRKKMTKIMQQINPDWDSDFIKEEINKLIEERCVSPDVTLDNNYTHEKRESTLIAVLDWVIDKEPIICGNATFYKNQHQAVNPIASMLESFLSNRKMYKKKMFKIGEEFGIDDPRYKDFDLKQGNEKILSNSYYGASGAPSAAFYSEFSGPATTHSAQTVISTAEQLFEGFLADNYYFLNMTELLEWCAKVMTPYTNNEETIHDWIQLQPFPVVIERLLDKIIDREDTDEEILEKFLSEYSDQELAVLYYKNNLIEFIKDHEIIQSLILSVFENVDNLPYADKNDTDWFSKIPKEYRDDFVGKSYKDWNNFVNTEYFMDPNKVPDSIRNPVSELSDYFTQYVYCKYLSFDRIYRLKNFKRKVVTVIDTDSNILSIDTVMNYILDEVVNGQSFGREDINNIFIGVNMIAYTLTNIVTDLLLHYGECSNIPEEYRPIYSMKNEFLFLKLVIGMTKKRYMSKITLREGNYINPPKYDIKGFDFKKATCSEYSEKVYMGWIEKYILNSDTIMLKELLKEVKDFQDHIRTSILNGETQFLQNASVKEPAAYARPESIPGYRGVLTWNILNPDHMIELPAKVSMLKLTIFTEEDLLPLKEVNEEAYNLILDKIFHDKSGIFVTETKEPGITYVSVNNKNWFEKIPKKYRAKYKKLGPDEWNKFVDTVDSNPKISQEEKDGIVDRKVRGLQCIAIPANGEIPSYLQPFIDYSTTVNDILSPFRPVLEIFKSKTVGEGKSHNGINRKSEAFTNIVKF